MTENIKPLLTQIKSKLNDPNLRASVLENFEKTRQTVESKAKDVLQQTKDSRLVADYVMPLIESEKTETALKKLNAKFGHVGFIGKLEGYRQALIDAKSAKAAAPAATETVATEPVAPEDVATEAVDAAQTKTPRKSKAKSEDI